VPRLSPFHGLVFDAAVAGPLDRVTAPPYDVISDRQRLELLRASPFSVVHLDLVCGGPGWISRIEFLIGIHRHTSGEENIGRQPMGLRRVNAGVAEGDRDACGAFGTRSAHFLGELDGGGFHRNRAPHPTLVAVDPRK